MWDRVGEESTYKVNETRITLTATHLILRYVGICVGG